MAGEPAKGKLIIEGKTKCVFEVVDDPHHVLVENKDAITAFDGAKGHDMEGKAAISNATNAKVFQFLNESGIATSWTRGCGATTYVSRRCHMVPLEWVTRRVATGSFLKRNQGVNEGYRFTPPKLETFFKDDANHDPQWSMEQILESKLNINGTVIGQYHYDIMARTTLTVFEVLERAWGSIDCALVDMKIEFGIDAETGELLVSDTIDSDSWRLWPSGDKRLMKDKQVYRNMETVTEEGLNQVKRNFQWVADKLDYFIPKPKGLVVVLMGSPSDMPHCEKIQSHCNKLGVPCELRITSAHKGTQETLSIVAAFQDRLLKNIFIKIIKSVNRFCPDLCNLDSYKAMRPPNYRFSRTGLTRTNSMGAGTVIYPEAAAQSASTILGLHDHVIWSKIRAKQLNLFVGLKKADKKITQDLKK
ncbi:unnamed protein product, partial [Meganyctiphanes norvegica]